MKVTVTKENVVITECSCINEGEYKVNKCEFQLPQCFEGLTVTASFDNIPVPLFGGECYIPTLKKGTATLGVYAYRETEDGLELMYSPKPTMFYVDSGSYSDSIGKEELPETSVFEKYCKEISQLALPKSSLIDRFDPEIEVSSEKIFSADAILEFTGLVASEFEMDREEISSLRSQCTQMSAQVNDKIVGVEERLYGMGNALKGSRSDVRSLSIEDVSPVAHSLNVRLSSNGVNNYNGTQITVSGKNLFGFEGRTVKDLGGVQNNGRRSFTGDGIYLGLSGNNYYNPSRVEYEYDPVDDAYSVSTRTAWYGVAIDVPVNAGEVYSVNMQSENENARVILSFFTAQGDYISFVSLLNGKVTVPADAKWMLCILTTSQASTGTVFKNVQLERGSECTSYCKYVQPKIYSTNINGYAYGVKSISPVMIIDAGNDAFTVSAEYNRDINTAFKELREAIERLGGIF